MKLKLKKYIVYIKKKPKKKKKNTIREYYFVRRCTLKSPPFFKEKILT
jgi:hypothetical protein